MLKLQNQKVQTYNGKTSVIGTIKAKVISMGDVMQTNVNGTNYVVGTIEIEGKQFSAICYEANLAKVEVGNEYICNVTFTEDQPSNPIIAVSPLTGGVRATAEDFGFDFKAAVAEVGIGAEEVEVN